MKHACSKAALITSAHMLENQRLQLLIPIKGNEDDTYSSLMLVGFCQVMSEASAHLSPSHPILIPISTDVPQR